MSQSIVKDRESTEDYWLVARIQEKANDLQNDFFVLRFELMDRRAGGVSMQLTFKPQRPKDPDQVVTPELETYGSNGYVITHDFGVQYGRVVFKIVYTLPDHSEPLVIERFASHTQGGAVTRPISQINVQGREAPRLSVALNSCPVPDPTKRVDWSPAFNVDDPGEPELIYLMKRIMERLTGGLDRAWRYADLHAGRPQTAFDESSLNEQWARLYTEQFLGARYSSPGNSRKDVAWDGAFFRPMQNRPDPPLPLMLACQQACTAGLILYGFRPLDLPNLYRGEAGTQRTRDNRRSYGDNNEVGQNKLLVQLLGGVWFDNTVPNPITADNDHSVSGPKIARLIKEFGLGPNSTITFNEKKDFDPEEEGAKRRRHIAHVLRIDGAEGRLQFFDVRGMQTRPNPDGQVVLLGLGHRKRAGFSTAYDDPFNGKGGAAPFFTGKFSEAGIGILPFSEESARRITQLKKDYPESGKLDRPAHCPLSSAAIQRMQNAWPIGFVRLLLLDRWNSTPNSPKVVFATPLLRMHTTTHSFFISRLMWSLRNLPFAGRVQAIWQVDIPMRESTQLVLDSARTDERHDLVERCLKLRYGQDIPHDIRYGNSERYDTKLFSRLSGIMPWIDIESQEDGTVKGVPRGEWPLHTHVPIARPKRSLALKGRLSWREARGVHKDLYTHPDVPAYLRGVDV